jgi:FMN phosphatase YigB (HAD superfamily)
MVRISGDVSAVFFDFDGTLTATPGVRAERRAKIIELKERASMLQPWLLRLRRAGISLGIISKSTESTIRAALAEAGLEEMFDLPIVAKAVGFAGKAGFIEEMATEGPLEHLGSNGMHRILLVDDDVSELEWATEISVQTYPAPLSGGLQESDFCDIFERLSLPHTPRPTSTPEVSDDSYRKSREPSIDVVLNMASPMTKLGGVRRLPVMAAAHAQQGEEPKSGVEPVFGFQRLGEPSIGKGINFW